DRISDDLVVAGVHQSYGGQVVSDEGVVGDLVEVGVDLYPGVADGVSMLAGVVRYRPGDAGDDEILDGDEICPDGYGGPAAHLDHLGQSGGGPLDLSGGASSPEDGRPAAGVVSPEGEKGGGY